MRKTLFQKLSFSLLVTALSAWSLGVNAQGDDCSTAVIAAPGIITADGPAAGGGQETHCFTLGGGGNADWYVWTPANNGTATVQTCNDPGGVDSRLSIGTGTCGALFCHASNDDACGTGTTFSSTATFAVTAGTPYYVQWDDRWSTAGYDWELLYTPIFCSPPAGTTTPVSTNCPVDWSIDVDVTSLGDGASTDISYTVNAGTPVVVLAVGLGITNIGPFLSGDVVDVSLLHDTDPACDVVLGSTQFNCPVIVNTFPYCSTFDAVEGYAQCGTGCGNACVLPAATGWSNNVGGDGMDWTVDANGTGSSGTGPTGDNPNGPSTGTGFYLYTETSGTACQNTTADLYSPNFDVSGFTGDVRADMWYHMLGTTIGTVTVEIEDPAFSNSWTTLFSVSGDQGSAWLNTGQMDHTATGPEVRYRVRGATGTSFTSDMAIDDFCVSEATCSLPLATASTSAVCGGTTFDVVVDITDLSGASSVDIVSDVNGVEMAAIAAPGIFTVGPYPSGSAVNITVTHNDDASCDLDLGSFSVTVPGSITAPFCEDWDSMTPACNSSAIPVLSGGWTNLGPQTWQACNGPTSSTATGPSFDITGGNYLYTEGSGGAGDRTMVSPCIDISGLTTPNLNFNYHQFGAGMANPLARIEVDVEDPALSGNWTNVVILQDPSEDQWKFFTQDLVLTGPEVRVRFFAHSPSFDSDMAVDNICMLEAPTCTPAVVNSFTPIDAGDCSSFTIEVDIASLGTATGLDIFVNGVLDGTAVATGIYTTAAVPVTGPLQTATIDVVPDDDPIFCAIPSGVVQSNCPCDPLYTSAPNDTINNTLPPTVDIITIASGGQSLIDMDVVVDITHTFLADLTIELLSPMGTTVILQNAQCGGSDNMTIWYNDEAAGPIVCATPTIGMFQPSGTLANLLSDFDGELADGDWTLTVTDGFGGDQGNLVSWCLIPTLVTCMQPAGTLIATNDCVAGTYDLVVDLTSLGDATTVTIETDLDGIISTENATGMYTVGTYPLTTVVTVTLRNDQFPACDLTLLPFSSDCLPTEFCGVYTSSPGSSIDSSNPTTTDVISTGPLSGEAIQDLDVVIEITHSFLADLDITLESPSGTIINLMNDFCGGNDNMELIFDDEAGSAITCGTPTVGRTVTLGTLASLLGAVDTELFEGDWTLRVTDDAGGDTGTLDSWCLVPSLAIPDCPSATNIMVTNVSETSVTLDWTAGVGNTDYIIEWGPAGFTPGSGTVEPTTALPGPATIMGLMGGTAYDFYITEVCPAGFSLQVGPTSATTLLVITTFPYCQDFETFAACATSCATACPLPATSGWSNLSGDDFDWIVDAGGTGSGGTGPSGDNTTAPPNGPGNYIYTETSFPCNVAGLTGTILSPAFDVSGFGFDPQLEFAWHMFGATMGTLLVEVEDPAGSNNWSSVFTRSGTFQSASTDAWEVETVPLNLTGGGTFRARFTGTSGAGFTSDMALDDLCVSEAPCNYPQFTFQEVNCDYINGTYDVEVNVTSLGSSTSLDIDTTSVNGTGLAATGIVAPGVFVFGPFDIICGDAGVSIDIFDPANLPCSLSAGPVFCPVPNDNCVDEDPAATMISAGSSVVFSGCVTNSTVDPQLAGVFGVQGLVWHSFTTTECVDLTIDWCGTAPAWGNGSLNLYSDCLGAPVNSQNFDATTCGDGNFTIFYVSLPPGEYYYPVFWDPPNNADGAYNMNVVAVAPATPCSPNTCADAEDIACGGVVSGTTVSNTSTQGPSVCLPNHFAPGPDAWYRFENLVPDNLFAAGDGVTNTYDLNSANTVINSVVLDQLGQVNALGDGVTTTYDLAPGTDATLIQVLVNGVPQVQGPPPTNDFELDLTTDNFGGETTWEVVDLSGPTQIAAGGPYASNTNFIEPVNALPIGNYEFTIFDAFGDGICCGFGTGSYTFTNITTSTVIVTGGTFLSSETTPFSVVAGGGGDYYLSLGTGLGGSDQLIFFSPPAVSDPVLIDYTSLVVQTDPADYSICAGCGGGGVDQLVMVNTPQVGETLTASYGAAGGDQLVTASLCVGTTYNSMLTVYLASPDCNSLVCVTGNDDNCGGSQQSEVNWIATSGAVYYIAVHGPSGLVNSTGAYTLSLTCAAPCTPQANDECAGAAPLSAVLADGSGVPTTFDNTCAFADANPTCDVIGANAGRAQGVWFNFNSGVNDFMFLTLLDNDLDATYTSTALSFALYSGACGALVEEQCVVLAEGTTQLNVSAGTDYWILVHNDGGIGIEGTFGLLLEFPPQNDAGISLIQTPDGTGCSSIIFPEVWLRNFGAQDLTSAEIHTMVDAVAEPVYNWVGGPIPFGDSLLVGLPSISVAQNVPHIYDASTMLPNGVVDEVPANDAALSTFFDASGEEVEVRILTDNFGGETTWEIYDSFLFLAASGGPYTGQNNTQISEFHCLPTTFGTCYEFRIFDQFGDGICCGFGMGNWELRDPFGNTVLLDGGNFGAQSPAMGAPVTGHEFCLPLGPTTLSPGECGVFTNNLLNKVFCEPVPGAPIYQFEFSDPDGDEHSTGYYRRRIALATRYVRLDQIQTNPIEYGVRYMVRVRADELGDGLGGFNPDHWSDACELGLDAGGPPCSQLIDDLGSPSHSCGVSRILDQGEKLWAQPVPGATDYQFQFENIGEGYIRNINPAGTYVLIMNTWGTNPLTVGSTYTVRVQSFANGTWSGYCGADCSVTIGMVMPPTANRDIINSGNAEVMLWPNPVRNEVLTLNVTELTEAAQNVTIDIYDMYGKVVYQEQLNNEGDELNTIIDFQDMSTGIYMVNITINDVTYVERLVIE